MTLVIPSFGQPSGCRTYRVPACEAAQSTSSSAVPAAATFQVRQRDVLDFDVDASDFLASLGSDAKLASAVFSVASSVTLAGTVAGAPTISGQGHSDDGVASVVLAPHSAAAVGDVYTLDCTLVTTSTSLAQGVTLPARTIVRRIVIIVVAG